MVVMLAILAALSFLISRLLFVVLRRKGFKYAGLMGVGIFFVVLAGMIAGLVWYAFFSSYTSHDRPVSFLSQITFQWKG